MSSVIYQMAGQVIIDSAEEVVCWDRLFGVMLTQKLLNWCKWNYLKGLALSQGRHLGRFYCREAKKHIIYSWFPWVKVKSHYFLHFGFFQSAYFIQSSPKYLDHSQKYVYLIFDIPYHFGWSVFCMYEMFTKLNMSAYHVQSIMRNFIFNFMCNDRWYCSKMLKLKGYNPSHVSNRWDLL